MAVNLQNSNDEELNDIFWDSQHRWLTVEEIELVMSTLRLQVSDSASKPMKNTTGLFLYHQPRYQDSDRNWRYVGRGFTSSEKLKIYNDKFTFNISRVSKEMPNGNGNEFMRKTYRCFDRHGLLALVHYREVPVGEMDEND